METRNDILNELREISPVIANIKKVNTYAVPVGYFDGIAGNLLSVIKEEQSPVLAGLKKQTGNVPEGYFDTLADSILGKIKAQEQEENYPVLNKISTQNVYTVPQGYFETLSTHIVAKTTQPQAKVVSMGKRSNWFKYAAAAVFTGVIMFGAFKYMGKTKTEVLPDYVAAGQQIKNVEQAIATAAEEDIIKYLQKEGTDVEAALIAATIDEKELPSQEDYLIDEKTLDNFLDNIDIKDLNN